MPETASPLDRLRNLVLADETLQHRLIALYDPADFLPAALDIAADAGIPLDRETIRAALTPDPLGIHRFLPRAATGTDWPGRLYLPANLSSDGGEATIDWVNVAGRRLAEPFYYETIQHCRNLVLNRLIRPRTPLASLAMQMPADGGRVPDGFVFHLSRCGSTLVAQMLAADPTMIVASEPPPLDQALQLLQSRPDIPIEERAQLLRAMVGAIGRDRFGDARRFVVKLDSWHTLALPLLRHAFPDTPWVYLYRDPVDILVSHVRQAGMQAVADLMPGVYDIPDAAKLSPLDYTATVLDRINAAVLAHWSLGGGLTINYDALPAAVEAQILPHFDIAPDAPGLRAMRAAAVRNAKAPQRAFLADTAAKQRDATPAIRAAARIVADTHHRLETLRSTGPS